MSYTVGVKRRFWFGYRKVMVTGHDWQNGRFILNLTDGSQEHIPGFSAPQVKVYADFWTHLAQVERSRPAPRPVQAAAPQPVASVPQQETVQTETVQAQPEAPQVDPLTAEIRRRAQERVKTIMSDWPQ